ncbi:MAG: aminotransferase class III-fold pyridoxal phosphate-dependent enzyme [Deltaproteobacteria bacterium]|nr:aminotransferase class III-fold pyridoxal phosphate-dependent enzyme [Nannocystaceae bacterium]
MNSTLDRYATSRATSARAREIIAGGQHLSGRALLSEQPPLYLERGKGCRVLDVDGNEYIDYLLAYGAIVLGYADEEVDAAAFAQARQGQLLSLNHRLHVEFAECLLRWFPAAELAMFMKTGSEATTAALRIARRATGRRRVIRCGYHGWHDWCLPLEGWVPDGLDEQVLEFDANDPDGLTAILAAYPREVAAVIVAPEMVLPSRGEPLHRIAALTRAAGAVFVLDEVKTAFRIRPGSIQRRYDLTPDLTTVSKALGNGWPVAAVLGTRAVMEHATGMHCSATYHGEVSAMAAAMRTLELIEERGVLDHVWTQGERLIEGFERAAVRHGLPIEMFGEPLPPMPMLRVTGEDAGLRDRITQTFFGEMMKLGVLLHPRHLWFMCAEHSAEDVRRTIDAADQAMELASRT